MSEATLAPTETVFTPEELEDAQAALNTEQTMHVLDRTTEKPCGTGTIVGRERDTGRVFVVPACCKKWTCPRCAPRLQRRWAARVAAAAPQRFVTFTVDPKLHDSPYFAMLALKEAFQRFVEFWRKGRKKSEHKIPIGKHVFEYFAIWELQESGMPHLHVLQKGDYIPQEFLKKWMQHAGVGSIVDVRKLKSPTAGAKYVVKYTQKTAAATKEAFPYNRLIMVSRNFFPKSKEPPDTDDKTNVDWFYTPITAYEVLSIIARGMKYNIVEESFPFQIELQPTDQDLGIDALQYYCGPPDDP